jgi:hypothetical protein
MRYDNNKLAILCGALLVIGLAGCNREQDQMETSEAASASTAAGVMDTAPTDTMADTTAPTDMPPSAVTSAADVTAEAPPSTGLGEPSTPTTAADPTATDVPPVTNEAPMDNTETQQPPADGGNAPQTR